MTALTIHIGMNKTGTTALQKALFHNRSMLERAGLLYPKTGLGSRSAGRGLHYRLSEAFRQGDPEGPAMVTSLLAEIDASTAETAIISSEFFVELRDPTALANTLRARDVRILVYLRRHDQWVSSLFSQAIKSQPSPPWGPSVEDFIQHIRRNVAHYYVYSRLLDRWAEAFGQDAMAVRLYRGGNIVPEVLKEFGLDPTLLGSGLEGSGGRENASPSRRQLAAIDHVQRAPYPDHVRSALVRRILAADDGTQTRNLMTAETARTLIEEHREDYARIAQTYLGRTDGVLFDDPIPEPGGPQRIALWPGEGIAILSRLLSETI